MLGEQAITAADQPAASCRRAELALDAPTQDSDATIRSWINLPDEISAGRIAELSPRDADPHHLAERLLALARNVNPRQVVASKRGPNAIEPKGYVDGKAARAHVATARIFAGTNSTF